MYERYYVVDKTLETVGDAWFDSKRKIYIVSVASLGEDLAFGSFESMEHHLLNLGLDVV